MVEYRVGESILDHHSYMRLLGVYRDSKFCRFSRDLPLAGFEALRSDLEKYCADFLIGPEDKFQRLAMELKNQGNG